MSDAVETTTEVPAAKPARAARKPKTVASANADGRKGWVKIVLEDNDNVPPTGLPLGCNGRFFFLRTGEPAEVPPEVLEILNHAVASVPVVDPDTQKIVAMRDRMRYPYRLVQ